MYALQLIGLQSQGVPGRKNVLWIGYGAPIAKHGPDGRVFGKMVRFAQITTNMLLDARISLFLINPGFAAFQTGGEKRGDIISRRSAAEAEQTAKILAVPSRADPFAGDIRFGAFASATGGHLFYSNVPDNQIERARSLGSGFYTLTCQPQQIPADGRFRNVRVTMRNPELQAVTKTGYFAPIRKT